MISFVFPENIYSLRQTELRQGSPIESTHFVGDFAIGTFHLGYIMHNEVLSIVSFCLNVEDNLGEMGYQLRGMATQSNHKGNGLGTALCSKGFDIIKSLDYNFVWCNARESAVGFYAKMGFECIGEYFEIPTAGKHIRMVKNLSLI